LPKQLKDYSTFRFTPEQEKALIEGRPNRLIKTSLFRDYPRWVLRRKKRDLLAEFDESRTKFTSNANTGTAIGKTVDRVMTPEQLIEHCEIDLDVWYVDRQEINKWEVARKGTKSDIMWAGDGIIGKDSKSSDTGGMVVQQLFQVKVFLKRIGPAGFDHKAFKKEIMEDTRLIKSLTDQRMDYPNLNLTQTVQNLLLVNIFDLHYDKLAWSEETGYNWNPEIAEKAFWRTLDTLLSYAENFPISEIWFPIGNDFFNSDGGYPNATTRGTPQEIVGRWQKTFREGRIMLAKAISRLSRIAPVVVPVIPGNHDWQKSFYLGDSLECFFQGNPAITIDNKATPRKYYTFGQNLIGFTHGKDEKLDCGRRCSTFLGSLCCRW